MGEKKARLLNRELSSALVARLSKEYPNAKYYLDFGSPIDLLVAAILSAQTRDEVVNSLTPKLFSRFKTAEDYAKASKAELLKYVGSASFAGNKASNIITACKIISSRYNGKVPNKMVGLVELPGIGRKTANTILINAYGIVEGIPVDTWVIKLSFRMGLSQSANPDRIERDLMASISRKYWGKITYLFKVHGKAVCRAVPLCSKCAVKDICPKNGVSKMI